MLKILAPSGAIALCVFGVLSSAQAQEAATPVKATPAAVAQGDVLEVINSSPEYSLFATMLQQSGMAPVLDGHGPFTVFVPTNAALSALPAGMVEQLLQPQNKGRLAALITEHILPGAITSDSWSASPHLGMALGGNTLVYVRGPQEQVNNAPVVAKDIPASNGVIHVINGVLARPNG